MTTGQKIAKIRKDHLLTQEDLAEQLGVTRQAVSRWESDLAYPETDKLIFLAEKFQVDLNYLLKRNEGTDTALNEDEKEKETTQNSNGRNSIFSAFRYEYKSKLKIGSLPLVHINLGMGMYKAKGVLAIGTVATGILSIGLFSLGILSIGLLGLGIFSLGCLAVGLLTALGAISIGTIAMGAIAVGVLSVGALSIGMFSVGALSIGKYFAMGDVAIADIALGITEAKGRLYACLSSLPNHFEYDKGQVVTALDTHVPKIWAFFVNIIKFFL